jgi:glycosyltransferase involved in cell wall biosynthesis
VKLIIQIPCFNEEYSLPVALSELPEVIKGIDKIEVLVIDDGSTDKTKLVAEQHRVQHILSIPTNKGLANAFMSGLDFCLKANADIIVNTDADNQYFAGDIEKLVQPILNKEADIVVGARPISQINHFSFIKKLLQKIGSWVVRYASQTQVQDAPSGFRAISYEAALKLAVFNRYTYTLETIIQAGQNGMKIISIPVSVNEEIRPSRLVKNIGSYIYRSVGTILRIFMIYRPGMSFFFLGLVPFVIGFLISLRWVVLYFIEEAARSHLPSLILSAVLMIVGFQTWLFGLFAELIATNRKLLEENKVRLRRLELQRYKDIDASK